VWCVQLQALLAEMESRAARKEYQQLLADCHALYCEQRLALVSMHTPAVERSWATGTASCGASAGCSTTFLDLPVPLVPCPACGTAGPAR
jgi:hypothetical protein